MRNCRERYRRFEDIQIGEMVLSQSAESGELTYKPVVATTVRPAERLMRITTEQDTIEATGGHSLFVGGSGWILARAITSRMRLFCLDRSAEVIAAEAGGIEETYNLVVADFNTYFIGKSRILCHDNTRTLPTNAILPDLVRRKDSPSQTASLQYFAP